MAVAGGCSECPYWRTLRRSGLRCNRLFTCSHMVPVLGRALVSVPMCRRSSTCLACSALPGLGYPTVLPCPLRLCLGSSEKASRQDLDEVRRNAGPLLDDCAIPSSVNGSDSEPVWLDGRPLCLASATPSGWFFNASNSQGFRGGIG